MMRFQALAKRIANPEQLAINYLSKYYGNERIPYPVNPYQMLKDEGVLFSLMDFKRLEGVYIPASNNDDIPVVGINVNRRITRQRFTAAHELCHHFRDADRQISCPIGGEKNEIESYADKFAAALLMPLNEMRRQVAIRLGGRSHISMDDVLEIADFFGVSFEACLFRIAYKLNAIEGEIEAKTLRKRASEYRPERVRKSRHMSYAKLYAGLIDCYQEQLAFEPTEFARFVFQNDYIYNDSRMEGLEITLDQASEIVSDLRLNMQNSEFCTAEREPYLSIAGHYEMYKDILATPVKDTVSVFDTLALNRKLFSHYPHPEFGGSTRRDNTLVLGAKFESTDYHSIVPELLKLDEKVKEYFERRMEMPVSEYVKHVVRTHHRITSIHPFPDGNGRTARAFMNVQLVRAGLLPVYIKAKDKDEYVKALARADKCQDYEELYEIVFRLILRSYVDLNKTV